MNVADTHRQFFFSFPPNMSQNDGNSSCHCQQATVTTPVAHLCEATEHKCGFKKIIFYTCFTGISFRWSVDKLLRQETLYLTSLWFKHLFYEFLWITY
jgi:hypothetical protein